MDRDRLYAKLDIDGPGDFEYYESFDALMEDEEHIEQELISEIFEAADQDLLLSHVESFFESFQSNIPDEETELSIIIDIFKNNISSSLSDEMNDDELHALSEAVYNFRNWYAIEHNAYNETTHEELSVRDARYEIVAAKFLGEERSIDFGRALTSGPDAYEVKLRDII